MLKSINIDSELHKKLKVYCAEHGTTITKIVNSAIENVLSEKEFIKRKGLPLERIIPVFDGSPTVSSEEPVDEVKFIPVPKPK